MFGIGLPEMLIIAAVALVFIGPDKLPGVLRSLGKGLVELKRATNDVRSTVQDEMHKIEDEIDLKEVRESAKDLGKEFEGVSSKMDSLSLSKMSTGEQLESIANVLDKTEKDIPGLETEKLTSESKPEVTEDPDQSAEITSTKSRSNGLTASDFPAPETTEIAKESESSMPSDKATTT